MQQQRYHATVQGGPPIAGALRHGTPGDLVVEQLADDVIRAEQLLVEALIDAEVYRRLALEGLAALHARGVELAQLRERHARLLDEYRHLRGQVMRQAAAA